jgi:hypothetical protein
VNLKRMTATTEAADTVGPHSIKHYAGRLSPFDCMRMLREARGSLRRFPTRYEGGVWECPESNKIFSVQVYHNRRTVELWADLIRRCGCHTAQSAEEQAAQSNSGRVSLDDTVNPALQVGDE